MKEGCRRTRVVPSGGDVCQCHSDHRRTGCHPSKPTTEGLAQGHGLWTSRTRPLERKALPWASSLMEAPSSWDFFLVHVQEYGRDLPTKGVGISLPKGHESEL